MKPSPTIKNPTPEVLPSGSFRFMTHFLPIKVWSIRVEAVATKRRPRREADRGDGDDHAIPMALNIMIRMRPASFANVADRVADDFDRVEIGDSQLGFACENEKTDRGWIETQEGGGNGVNGDRVGSGDRDVQADRRSVPRTFALHRLMHVDDRDVRFHHMREHDEISMHRRYRAQILLYLVSTACSSRSALVFHSGEWSRFELDQAFASSN